MSRLSLGLWLLLGACATAVPNGGGPADGPRLDAFVQLDSRSADAEHADAGIDARPIDARLIDAPPDAHETSCASPFTATCS